MTGKADAVRAVSQQFKDRTNTVIEGVMAQLREDNAKEILGPGLSPLIGRGSLKSIVTFALYADVLRMVRDVVMADGEISDEEVQESLGLLSVLAAGFAKVRKEYASFTQLTPETARQFLSQYESDSGLFGHANESTKWAGVNACRNVEAKCGDSGPVNTFCGTLVLWAESVASADGMSPEEQQHLNAFRQIFASARNASPSPTPPNDAEAATRELNQGGSNESKDGVTEDKILTRDEAERFVADQESVNLSEYASLKDDAAAILASSREDLCLDGLKEISATAAQALIPHTGAMSLQSLENLTPSAAQCLSRHAGPLRELNLGAFVDEPLVFAALRKHVSLVAQVVQDDLMAQSLRTKDIDKEDEYEFEFADASSRDLCDEEYYGNPMDDGLRLLARAEGRPVWSVPLASVKDSWVCENAGAYTLYFIGERDDVLKRLETLPNRVATPEVVQDFLQQYESGDWDGLSSYGALDLEAAATLATDFPWGDGNELWLSGLRALPSEVAAALSQPQPQDSEEGKVPILVMSSLRQLTAEAAKALSGRKWALQLCVEELSAAAAEYLASAQDLYVEMPRLDADVAVNLSRVAGALTIEINDEISAEAALALGTRSGSLCLLGLPSLSVAVARGLAAHKGKLDLGWISSLSPDVARILCTHDGELKVMLEAQLPAVATILKQHPSLG